MIHKEYKAGTSMLVFAVVVPLLLWLSERSQTALFTTPLVSITTIAQVTALAGLGLFALNPILSGRYHFIDKSFGGLDRAYRWHRYFGIAATCLLLGHGLAIVTRQALSNPNGVITFLLDTTDRAILPGKIALVGLLVIVALTLSRQFSYEWLKRNHQTLGVFLLLGGIHAYLIPSDVAVNQPLRWYMLGLVALGLTSYTWRTLLKHWLVKKHSFSVTHVQKLSDNVTEVSLTPLSKDYPKFIPGQFNFYRFQQKDFPNEDHPFSITASSEAGGIKLSAKAVGDFTKKLPQLKPGATATVQGPFGGFSYQRVPAKQQIWIAGGIGITPFISMARTIHDTQDTSKEINLIWSVKDITEAIYDKELTAITQALPNIHYTLWVSDKQGFLTAEALQQKIPTIKKANVLLCGPPVMITSLKKQLQTLGIPRTAIYYELFKLL